MGVEQHKKIHALSKGYKQRVGLAASIIHDPKVLILDEPTTGLDPNQIVEIRSLIASLGSKKTVMLSTHIMQEVEAICNNVIIINKGIIVANDKAENLSIYSAKGIKSIFVEFLAENDFQTSFLSESVEKIENKGNNKYIAYSKTDIREDIFKWAVTNNEILISMNLQEKNLEDMFRELTKDIKQSNA